MTRRSSRPVNALIAHYLLTGLLLIAAVLRFAALPDVPPGVAHDEVAEVLIAESILEGDHAIFFHEAYGQEPLFLYLVAGAIAVLGRNVLALRFVAASIGLLTVAAGARWARRLFGRRVAIATAAGLGVMFWPVFWSRVGLRGMLLPLTMTLGADALYAAIWGEHSRRRRRAVWAGLWLGASAYTYLASRGVPLLLAGWGVLLWLLERDRFRRRWRAFLLACLVAALVAAPLVTYLLWNKSAQTRVYQVDAPLRALRAGDPGPMLANVPRIAGMFTVAGDATARNNLPGRPVFPEPISAVLFYLGLVVSLVRLTGVVVGGSRRGGELSRTRYGVVIGWLGVMVLPSLVTTEAPNFVRTLGALPAVMVLLGIGVDAVLRWLGARSRGLRVGAAVVLAMAFGLNTYLTAEAYFVRWPREPEVAFVWQMDLAAVAAWLDAHPTVQDVTVGGLSTTSMDAPTLDLLMKRPKVEDRWCDTGSPLSSAGALLIPAGGGRLLVPDVVPLDEDLLDYLDRTGGVAAGDVMDHERFREFRLSGISPENALDVAFVGGITLLDVFAWESEGLTMMTVWRAEQGDLPDLKVALHLVDAEGGVRAQHDGLDCPARFWRAGDQIVQLHPIPLPESPAPDRYQVRVSLYDPQTLAPYPLTDGQPFYDAGTIEVGEQ